MARTVRHGVSDSLNVQRSTLGHDSNRNSPINLNTFNKISYFDHLAPVYLFNFNISTIGRCRIKNKLDCFLLSKYYELELESDECRTAKQLECA